MSPSRPAAAEAAGPSYAGERLGLPEKGPGSVAGWGRRVLALAVDWLASTLVAIAFTGVDGWIEGTAFSESVPLLVFLLEASFLTAVAGGSFGQLACRVTVTRLDGRPVNLLQSLLRTFLICLVVPPLVFNRDRRGLHDLAVGTLTRRR
ncbi:MAG: RDD family protein [Actinomycetota bacterium]|nr:RDD family protein [Actinomycetota bacterium]